MIYKIKQVSTNFNMQWYITDNNCSVAEINSPFETHGFNAYFEFVDNEKYRLYYNPFDKESGKKISDRLSFKIYDATNEMIGRFLGRTHKTGRFFGGYAYFELNLCNKQFIGYEVGRGKEGIALCLYQNDNLLGIIDKNTSVVNFKDEYTMYLVDENLIHIAALFSVYYDMLRFANVGEIKLYSQTETYMITTNKELKAKYDPSFIPKIIAMEENNG